MTKFSILPENIKDIISSDLDIELNLELVKKYQVKEEKVSAVSKISAELFVGDLKVDSLVKRIQADFNLNEEQAKDMAMDFVGIRLLFFNDYYQDEPVKFLKALGGKPENYVNYLNRHQKTITEINQERLKEKENDLKITEVDSPAYIESNEEEELKNAPDLFKNSLTPFLSAESEEMKDLIEDYNAIIVSLLNKYPDFKKELENALYENQEEISNNQIILEGKRVSPTVSNWLKDFIAQEGIDLFTNIRVSEYLVSSRNTSRLNEKDKKILSNLLYLYGAIKFFPQTFLNTSPQEWQLIPVEIKNDNNEKDDVEGVSELEKRAMSEE